MAGDKMSGREYYIESINYCEELDYAPDNFDAIVHKTPNTGVHVIEMTVFEALEKELAESHDAFAIKNLKAANENLNNENKEMFAKIARLTEALENAQGLAQMIRQFCESQKIKKRVIHALNDLELRVSEALKEHGK